MKSLLAGLLFLVFVTSANAAFTRDTANNYATDDVSGLDWLALTETLGQAYNDAETVNTGWRYATNTEVEAMFDSIFPNYANENASGYSDSYTGIITEAIAFRTLFGATNIFGGSFGVYRDESSALSLLGSVGGPYALGVYGTNYSYPDISILDEGDTGVELGNFMVRAAAVPEASSLYLLAFGLLGLLGAIRRKV